MSRRGDTSAGNSFFTMSQFSNSIGDFRSKIDCPDPDGDQNSLFGGPSVRDSKPVHPKSADGPTYTFRTPADNRAVRTTGNQPRQRAIGLNLPLVVASDGLEDLSTATPGLLDSDRSLRSHSSIINEQKDFRLSSRFDSSNMTDEIGPDGSPGCYSPDIDMSRSNSRVSTAQTRPGGYQAFQPPLSPMKSVVPMSYTEQLEYNQRAQADSIKPQVNNLSPLMLSGQPRSQEDLIRQSPSHSNGGRAQTAASVNPVSGISLLSGAFSHISSSESIYSQGSESSGASRGSKSRGGNKIITGLPGQDPMSVSAYRRFVGTAAASNN